MNVLVQCFLAPEKTKKTREYVRYSAALEKIIEFEMVLR